MSEEIVRDPEPKGEAEFVELLEASCPEMHVVTGTVGLSRDFEQSRSEIQIAIPGERAVVEILYRTCDGSPGRQTMTDRHISVIPAGERHQLICPRGTDMTLVRIAPDLLKRIARDSGLRAVELVAQYGVFDPVIWHLGRTLRSELRRHRQLDGTYLQSVAIVLTRHLLSTCATAVLPVQSGGLPRFKLRRAIDYIHEHKARDISFRDIAAHVRISASHFARVFKQSTGITPHDYIVKCRVERAKALLADPRLPISDVAFEVGYKSQSHFTACFSRVTGITPGAFRAGR